MKARARQRGNKGVTDIFWDLDEDPCGLRGRKVLVVGDAMEDRIHKNVVTSSDARRHHALDDQDLFFESREPAVGAPGGAASFARAWTAFGEAVVCGTVGNDDAGRALTAQLEEGGITAALVPEEGRQTIVKSWYVLRPEPGQPWTLLRIDQESPRERGRIGPETEQALLERIETFAEQCDALAIRDFDKGSVTPAIVSAVVRCSQTFNKPLFVAAKRGWGKYRRQPITVICVDEEEARHAIGAYRRQADGLAADVLVAALQSAYPPCANVVARWREGGAGYATAGELRRVTSGSPHVRRAIRAGDAFGAYLLAAMLANYDILQAVRLGCLAATVAQTKLPFEWPDYDDVLCGIRGPSGSCGMLTLSDRKLLSLICRGIVSNREIAQYKGVTEQTVASEVHDLMSKLGVNSRVKLPHEAQRRGLLTAAMRIYED